MLNISLDQVTKATLPCGFRHVGFLGVSPGGDEYHLLFPVEVARAMGTAALGMGQAPPGGRVGWQYHLVPTYNPPAGPDCARSRQEDVMAARRAQAKANAVQLVAWARRRGWWAQVVE